MYRAFIVSAALLALIRTAVGQAFVVHASPGKWKGFSDIDSIFPLFEIRIITESDEEKRYLNWAGEANFETDRSAIRRLEWTVAVEPRPKYVLWPLAYNLANQQPVPNPFNRFQLMSLKEVGVESKTDVADSIKRGSFDKAENIFQDINDAYQPHSSDARLAAELSLFVHQIYESMSDAAERFRRKGMHRLTANDQKKVIELERGWHRAMLQRYTNIADEAVNRRLAGTLFRWNEFSRFVHSTQEWPSDSINSAKAKQPPTLIGDLTGLHDDLKAVISCLVSANVSAGLKERIARNLAASGVAATEKKQLTCYAELLASYEKTDFDVDNLRLDDVDRAISAFAYFHHAESK